jgi:hypothetical protein
MGGVRVRWRSVGKVAALAAGGLIALQALPGLLRAPEPPPLAADVGLPRPLPGEVREEIDLRAGPADPARGGAVIRERVGPARVVRRSPPKARPVLRPEPASISTPPPAPPSAPAPAPAASPAPPPQPEAVSPAPPPAAPPPSDGSVEFAPH